MFNNLIQQVREVACEKLYYSSKHPKMPFYSQVNRKDGCGNKSKLVGSLRERPAGMSFICYMLPFIRVRGLG